MKVADWDARHLQPPFGHQGQWLTDDLDRINSPIAAVFALRHDEHGTATGDTSAAAASDQARRFLVATELGLLDARFSPGGNGGGRLESTMTPWMEVRDVLLTAETTLDDALQHRTRRRLTVTNPAIEINETADEDALMEFWRECVLRAGRPPRERPMSPD